MKETDYTQINDYFNGILSPPDRAALEARIQSDPDFAAAFKTQESMENWLKQEPGRQAMRQELSQLGQDYFPAERSNGGLRISVRNTRLLSLAAAFVLLLVAVWFVYTPAQRDLYAQYNDHAPLQLVVRGNAGQNLQAEAEKAFNAREYATALPLLIQIYQADSSDTTAKLYAGICQLEMGDYEGSRNTLSQLAAGNSALKSEAVWYSALSYVREGKQAQAREMLSRIDGQSDRFKQAQELLQKL